MFKSMTGFSRAGASADGLTIDVEIKSLNGRGLDINCRMPRQISSKEAEIRDMVRKSISRGNVNIYVNMSDDTGKKQTEIDPVAVKYYMDTLNQVKKDLKLKDAIKLEHILGMTDYIMKEGQGPDEESIWKLAKRAIGEALKEHEKMRRKEGLNIVKDFEKRVQKIHETVKTIESISLDSIPEVGRKYREKIARLMENDDIDEQRLNMEIVILSDKLDVSEECVRLYSHIKLFKEQLNPTEPPGRKLNFLIQEMHREVNTIGSKTNEIKVSHHVVALKEELERIREQIQNIE